MNLKMFKEVVLTEDEIEFLKDIVGVASNVVGGSLERRKITIEMYAIKHAERNTNALIDSNKKLAKSNDRHARSMCYLTSVLAFVAVVQVAITIVNLVRF